MSRRSVKKARWKALKKAGGEELYKQVVEYFAWKERASLTSNVVEDKSDESITSGDDEGGRRKNGGVG